ncbi:polysaccharide biosynthesis/export family protein [Sphingomonas sp. IC081]|uniref:polysaccharide biosynthesis/export family protein n=1 Tax=Sphingomonas sp. IC081 TaxID=304378 RepID=UPI001159F115|nr:polysaccharide biosynthesis/export family protein [Sphingomonas sp. IC081]QDK34848.1 capsular biosynthesis protein [Sphingomonas sp. IC081]
MTVPASRCRRVALLLRPAAVALGLAALSGCASFGSSGPSTGAITEAGKAAGKTAHGKTAQADADIHVVDLSDAVIGRGRDYAQSRHFSDLFGTGTPVGTVIGTGDVLDIGVWEAPPAVLFGSARVETGMAVAQGAAIPQQMVGEDGTVTIPFVGQVPVLGRTPAEVERTIAARLKGRAHDPQVVVRLVQNEARTVTVLGEVGASRRVPLTARGERLLDIIASSGGPRQPVGKTTLQLARGTAVARMPLDTVVRDPKQNIIVQPGDVLTVMFQPYSFIALGAVSRSSEVPFEGGGLSLAQALGRVGGLIDQQANVRGVFVFRLEDPAALAPAMAETARRTRDGKVPVIYRLDMSQAQSLFLAQDFTIEDRDVLFVSNAPAVDLQKFINTVSSAAFSVVAVTNSVN